jgi:hypothetical protein
MGAFSYQVNSGETKLATENVSDAAATYNTTYLYEVWSMVPTVTIDSISPLGSHNTVTADKKNTTVESKVEGNKITIYPDSSIASNGCSGSLNKEPVVKLKLNNRGQASKVALTFSTSNSDGVVHLYYGSNSKNGTNTTAYTWDDASGDVVQRFIGYNDAGSCDDSKAAGTLTSADHLEITYGDSTYSVPATVITIVNNRP